MDRVFIASNSAMLFIGRFCLFYHMDKIKHILDRSKINENLNEKKNA